MRHPSRVAVIVSRKDQAGMNIRQNLIERCGFSPDSGNFSSEKTFSRGRMRLYTVDRESVFCEGLDREIGADIFIFATRHRSSGGVNSLSVHPPGNWGEAMLGGRERSLCTAAAPYIKESLLALTRKASSLGYEITVEQTHHGPFLEKPCFFIEIGSSPKQWLNMEAGRIIAEIIIEVVESRPCYKTALLLGGGHYNHEANKVNLRTEYAVGHICAKHCLGHVDEAMVRQAIDRTWPEPGIVIVDWKGLGKSKHTILGILESLRISYIRSRELYEKVIEE